MKKFIVLFLIIYIFSNSQAFKLNSPYDNFKANIKIFIENKIDNFTIKNNNTVIKINITLSKGNYNLIIKKEFNKFFYKIFKENNIEPDKWNRADLTNLYTEDNIKILNIALTPINTVSINSSWGKIKYLFAN